MHLCPVEEIKIRQGRNRKLFSEEHIKTLAESIASSTGLIQLPVVTVLPDGTRELLAGERRLRAMQLLWASGREFHYMGELVPKGQIPHSLISEVDLLTARAIELEENIQRVNLTWQERVQSIAALHELRVSQNPDHTQKDTRIELGFGASYETDIKDAVMLSRHLDDPVIASAPTTKDAVKRLARKLENAFRAGLAVAGMDMSNSSKHHLQLGNAEELLAGLPENTFEVILTDPPYGVDAGTFRASMNVMHEYDDDWDSVKHLLIVLASQGYRVAKQQAHAYVFCDVLMFPDVRDIFDDSGWAVWPRPLIWFKDVGHIPNANLGPQRRYECILYANKGNKVVTGLYPDVISCPAVNEKFHAAQKPVDLLVNLLRRSVMTGDKILDPFCGSGSIFEAAEKCQCSATGFDNDPSCVQFASERIKAL